MKAKESQSGSTWQKSPTANLIRYAPSGIYFARARVGGKLIRQSLKTDVYSVAQQRLADLLKERLAIAETQIKTAKGRVTFAQALAVFESDLDANQAIKPGAKTYRRKTIAALLKSWPALGRTLVCKITENECKEWAKRFAGDYSPTVYNNTLGTLRMVLQVAVQMGSRYSNPALSCKKAKIRTRKLALPSREDFLRIANSIESAGGRFSQDCANLFRFLALGGFRKTEASHITFADLDFKKGQIHVRITKNGEARYVPMLPEMRALLQSMRAMREDEPNHHAVMRVGECQKAIDSATSKLELPRFTHHDLRHLFATTCIEAGVDVPTVSRWLGHKDGGALAMKVYGHIRDQHSTAMAARVSFAPTTGENIVPMRSEVVA